LTKVGLSKEPRHMSKKNHDLHWKQTLNPILIVISLTVYLFSFALFAALLNNYNLYTHLISAALYLAFLVFAYSRTYKDEYKEYEEQEKPSTTHRN
jgi:Ca2+/Na+ antiporter